MEKKEIIKIWDNGTLRELTQKEVEESKKENEVNIPHIETLSYNELVNSEIRKKYTESEEFAILRQKEEKPDEYNEYFNYCESCKAYVKEQKQKYGGEAL